MLYINTSMLFLYVVKLSLEVVLIFCTLYLIWRWVKLCMFWRIRGVKTYGYPPPIGLLFHLYTGRASFPQLTRLIFDENPSHSVIGTWILMTPTLLVKEPRLVHQILRDDDWTNRGFKDDPDLDPLSQHLINLDGPTWKLVRSWLGPSFGSVCVRNKQSVVQEEASRFIQSITSLERFDVFKSSRKLILNILSRISLGLSEIHPSIESLIQQAFHGSFWTTVRSSIRVSFPKLLTRLKCKRFESDHEKIFIKLVENRIRKRVDSQDIVQTLIGAYKQYKTLDQSSDMVTEKVVGSNAFAVLAAGYDTTANALAWGLCELARCPDVQNRLHAEIHAVLAQHGELCQAALHDMNYLNCTVSEILRLYPTVTITTRTASKATTINGIKVPKGFRIFVPIYAIQRDPEFFKYPDRFDPDRFLKEDVNKVAYMPFGKGPRICLGWRLAIIILKLSIISVLKENMLSVVEENLLKIEQASNSLFLTAKHPVFLKATPRNL